MDYCITTFCYGEKYTPIGQKWFERITNKCKECKKEILDELKQSIKNLNSHSSLIKK